MDVNTALNFLTGMVSGLPPGLRAWALFALGVVGSSGILINFLDKMNLLAMKIWPNVAWLKTSDRWLEALAMRLPKPPPDAPPAGRTPVGLAAFTMLLFLPMLASCATAPTVPEQQVLNCATQEVSSTLVTEAQDIFGSGSPNWAQAATDFVTKVGAAGVCAIVQLVADIQNGTIKFEALPNSQQVSAIALTRAQAWLATYQTTNPKYGRLPPSR